MNNFKVIIVEDVPLELKGTEGIIRNDIPEAEIIGTANNEAEYWRLIRDNQPDLVLLDLGLGGSTTVGVEICRHTKESYPQVKVLIFTGEILNEKLWVDVLDAGADGINLIIIFRIGSFSQFIAKPVFCKAAVGVKSLYGAGAP